VKTFEEVEMHYRYLIQNLPTNVHYSRIYYTLLAYTPHLEGTIKSVEDHIEFKKQEIEKYRESDPNHASLCQLALAYDYHFITLCDIATRYVSLEKRLDTGIRLILLSKERHSIECINSHRFVSKRERLRNALAWQIECGWDVPDPKEIAEWTLDERAIVLAQDINYNSDGKVARMGAAYWYRDYLIGDPVQELLDYGYVDFGLIP